VATSSDDIIELRQLDDVGIIVVLEERLGLEPGSEDGLEHPLCAFLVGISVSLELGFGAGRKTTPKPKHQPPANENIHGRLIV
jgi:hypothetical protein